MGAIGEDGDEDEPTLRVGETLLLSLLILLDGRTNVSIGLCMRPCILGVYEGT